MSKEYYKNALGHILNSQYDTQSSIRVLYFSEPEDMAYVYSVIEHLRETYKEYSNMEFVYINDTIEDWEQLLLMSCCNHHIIANSSFSWWGAYFNQSDKKCVCYPSIWFGSDMSTTNVQDLFPPHWVKIHCFP